MKDLPIGVNTFEAMIYGNYLYVDKTKYLYELIKPYAPKYFLSRPRRFGKSLTVSTLEEIFLGKKELFKGLYIYSTDYDWCKYPVIRIDMSDVAEYVGQELETELIDHLNEIAQLYEIKISLKYKAKIFFKKLIQALNKKYNQKVVVLVDEYDKPILEHIEDLEAANSNREFLKNFYAVLKSQDSFIKFIFLTGVTKFSQISIFSGLNNLNDITMDSKYASLCGYTQEELEDNFREYIDNFIEAQEEKINKKETLEQIRYWYNGFRFSEKNITVYNPFSTLLLFDKKIFREHWFATGTPEFLINLIAKNSYPVLDKENKSATEDIFSVYNLEEVNLLPLLYQTGYFTIKDYTTDGRLYKLGYPNREVEFAFTRHLLSAILKRNREDLNDNLLNLTEELKKRNLQNFFALFRSFMTGFPYDARAKITTITEKEIYYEVLFFAVLRCLGTNVDVEVRTDIGRIDTVMRLKDIIYIVEFKVHGTKEDALNQIIEKKYYEKYLIEKREICLVGVTIDTEKRNLGEHIACKLNVSNTGNVTFGERSINPYNIVDKE